MADPVRQWREAHPDIDVSDEGIKPMAPFPSLFANDFAAYLSSKGMGEEIISFVREISREIAWAYGMWAKAQRDGDPAKLLLDLLNNSRHGAEYAFTHRFLRDYAKANNIRLMDDKDAPAWQTLLEATPEATPDVVPAGAPNMGGSA